MEHFRTVIINMNGLEKAKVISFLESEIRNWHATELRFLSNISNKSEYFGEGSQASHNAMILRIHRGISDTKSDMLQLMIEFKKNHCTSIPKKEKRKKRHAFFGDGNDVVDSQAWPACDSDQIGYSSSSSSSS